jgi:hypothetical protein
MNRIIDRLRKMRLGNRRQRIELLGGYPKQEPRVAVERFEPELNKDVRTGTIRDKVSQMGATSFDEATGNALETFITKEGEEWSQWLNQQHKAYKTRAGQRLEQDYAVVWQYRQLLDEELMRLRHAETAVETAVLALSGHEPDEADGHTRVIRVVTERPIGQADPEPAPDAGAVSNGESAANREFMTQPDGAAQAVGDLDALGKLDSASVLRPPRISRSELRRLFDPQDASRVPRWGEPGFRDGTLLAGRPRSTFVHVVTLVLAAGADIGAFTLTVQLVLPESGWVVLLVVFGLTAVVLYIAHMVGVMLREARAAGRSSADRPRRPGGRLGRGLAAFGCALIWLGVGGLAFWVRYTVPLPVPPQVGGCGGVIGSGSGSGCSVSEAATGHPLQAAAIFLGLYLATGVVAAVGAYVTHNPYRGGYVSALRTYRKASERAAASVHGFGLARAACLRQQAEIDESDQILAMAQAQNEAFTAQLKQLALIEIASMLKDPAVTDAFFTGT